MATKVENWACNSFTQNSNTLSGWKWRWCPNNFENYFFLSKLLESVLASWLLPIVEPYLDRGQCGGLNKSSINHYLIKLFDFVHTTVDQYIPHAVVLAALDLSKAYNRGDSMVIQDLHDMHTPGWFLPSSALTSRQGPWSWLTRIKHLQAKTYQGAMARERGLGAFAS